MHFYIQQLINKFEETEFVTNMNTAQPRIMDDAIQIQILEHFVKISVLYRTVMRNKVLKHNKFPSYKIQICQELGGDDSDR